MNNIDKISLSGSAFRAVPDMKSFEQYLESVVQAGYEYIELSRRQRCCFPEALPALRSTGLKVWSVHGILDGDSMSENESVRTKAVESAARWAEEVAEFAPCPLVEHYLDRYLAPENGIRFRRSVEELYARVSKLGFILCIETAPYKPRDNERYPDSAEIAAFVRSFEKDDLQMTVDLNHSNLHEDLDTVIDNTRGLVKNIHVSDNHGEKEEHLPPGDGIIDFRRAFRALRAKGYSGPCNLEFHFPGKPIPSAEDLRGVRLRMEKLLWDTPAVR